ncbi:MAG: SDR family NAD(P)-dependent oxidoreductase [Spirochaetales bacterium]|nr:SDR family NAD(P)-dependent oxidoreductase [Spirochaetales bacterium]
MDKKICIITGANSGIGKQAAIQLAGKGFHVILACRSRLRGQQAVDEILKLNSSNSVELLLIDMSLQASILSFAKEFKARYDRLDVLIHNAAVYNISQKKREETAEGIETIWAANHLGPVLLTELLLDRLKQSRNGRVLTVSSKGLLAKPFLKVNLRDPEYKTRRFNVPDAYYQSKQAQVMYTYWLAERLKGTPITVNSIRVTAVKVDTARHANLTPFMKWVYSKKAAKSLEPEKMAETYTYLANSPEVNEVTGRYYDEHNRQVDSTKYLKDKERIAAVMELTNQYISKQKEGF